MSEFLWKVFEIGVNLLESFVIIHFICAFMNHNFKSNKGKIVYIIGVLVDFFAVTIMNHYTIYEGILGILYVIVYFIFSLFFLNGTLLEKIFSVCLANLVVICISSFVTNIVSTVLRNNLSLIYEQLSTARICSIIVVQVLIICVYDLIIKFKFVSLNKSEWRLVLSVLGISSVSLAFIHITLIYVDLEIYFAELIMLAEFGIILLNIVCFYMTYSLSKSNSETEELRMLRQQEEYRTQYAEEIKNQYEEIRRMRHDMKQNFAVISALHNEGKYDEAKEYIDKISENLAKFDMIIDVENDFLNAILNFKLSIAQKRGIAVVCDSVSSIDGIEDIDLCNIIGNILDNAIEAAEKCDKGMIEVSIRSDENKIHILIANSIGSSVLTRNQELKSTKKDGFCHGYGVKTIKSIAEKYNGFARFNEEGKTFYCQAVMYKNNSGL